MKKLNYNSYAKNCVEELKNLQEKFQKHYDLTWYEDWFYNQSTGLLTFSTNEKELNFKYIDIGSFSEITNTWKWSWDNESMKRSTIERVNLVTEFGQKNNFPKLTNGYFKSSEIESWEFAAISCKILNCISVYRPVNNNNLQIFLALTEFIETEDANNIKDKFIACNKHEFRRRAFVCQHLNNHKPIGFEEAFDSFEDMEFEFEEDDFQAWCNECENIRQQEDGWNEKSETFANIKVVCEKCYFEMKEINLVNKLNDDKP